VMVVWPDPTGSLARESVVPAGWDCKEM
jgi:hypothetical protein